MDPVHPVPAPRAWGAAFATKFYRYRTVLRRHWWIMASTVAIGLACQAWLLARKPDLFVSSSELRVRDALALGQSRFHQPTENASAETLNLLASIEVREGAKRRLELEAPTLSGEVKIVPNVVPGVGPRTATFTVVGTGMNPEYTRRFVDAIVAEFIAFRRSAQAGIWAGGNHEISAELPTVVRKADTPQPVSKGVGVHLILGLIGGFAVGGLILFVVDRSDDRMTSSSELIEHFSEPILAQIPNVVKTRAAAGLPLIESEDERYSFAEAFRSLRSSLIFMPNERELKTIVITSAIPNEGKSTIAANLAITMAASGARVLLVDADLRRGDLASLFDTDGRLGLANILREEISWPQTVQPTGHATLSLIPRGPVTNQSGDLFLRPVLQKLLGELKEKYDLIVFNTAPVLATDDTPTLAPHFDGTLMVMRAQFTSARLTHNALNALYQRQVNVLGLILNCVDTKMPDYCYYRYPKYYAA